MRHFRFLPSCVFLGWLNCACDTSPQAQLPQGRSSSGSVGENSVTEGMLALWSEADQTIISDLVSDTLLSLESRASEPHRAAVIERAVLSRILIEDLRSKSLNDAAPKQAEIDKTIREQWLRFARPRAVRSVVVRVPVPTMVNDEPYRLLAEELRAASVGAHNIEGLLAQQATVETRLTVQRMRMPPVASDGRVVPMISQDHEVKQVEAPFAQTVSSLNTGELSPVFATSDAYQFVFATEVIDARTSDDEQSRKELAYRVAARRLKPELSQITHAKTSKVTYSTKDVAALLKLIWRE